MDERHDRPSTAPCPVQSPDLPSDASPGLADLLEAIPGIVWEISGHPASNHRTILVSPRVHDILGYSSEECATYPDFWLHVTPPEDRPEGLRHALMMWERGEPYRRATRMVHREGRIVWLEHHVTIVRHGGGEPIGLRGVSFDVTERYRAEAALAAERERLAVTLRSIGEAVITTDAMGRVVLLNPEAERLTGRVQADALGLPVDSVLRLQDPATRAPIDGLVDRVLRTGLPVPPGRRTVALSTTGAERIVSDTAAPIRGSGGDVEGVVLALRDVTSEEARSMEAERASRMTGLGALAGGIAHDFNNLLTCILGNLQLARILARGPGLITRLEAAEQAAGSARSLTQRLLAFARGGAPIRHAIDLADLLRETVTVALARTSSRPEFDISPALWPAHVDEKQMAQVLRSLVENAAEAVPTGGVVRVAARNLAHLEDVVGGPQPGQWVVVEVSDDGPGIPPDLLPHVFDPFVSTRTAGAGLGLATAWAVVQRHGGHIVVRSAPDSGTTVRFTLPAVEPDVVAVEPVERRRGSARILVMDDDPMMRATLEALIEALGCQIVTTEDGAQAVEAYREALEAGRPFDAVILDLTVPRGMGGRRAVRLLRELDPQVRAIVSSGYSNDPVMARAAEHGFVGVLPKPYTLDELRDTLASVIDDR